MAELATEPGYARRWAAKRDEIVERIRTAVNLGDLEAAQAELRELQNVAPENVPDGPARGERSPDWGQLAGRSLGQTCVYCETREGTGYDADGRCVCGDRECRRKARGA